MCPSCPEEGRPAVSPTLVVVAQDVELRMHFPYFALHSSFACFDGKEQENEVLAVLQEARQDGRIFPMKIVF